MSPTRFQISPLLLRLGCLLSSIMCWTRPRSIIANSSYGECWCIQSMHRAWSLRNDAQQRTRVNPGLEMVVADRSENSSSPESRVEKDPGYANGTRNWTVRINKLWYEEKPWFRVYGTNRYDVVVCRYATRTDVQRYEDDVFRQALVRVKAFELFICPHWTRIRYVKRLSMIT